MEGKGEEALGEGQSRGGGGGGGFLVALLSCRSTLYVGIRMSVAVISQ